MFDVSWNDPTQETRGQRKMRKGSHGNGLSRGSSVRSSGSSNSKASKTSDSTSLAPRPAIFGGFGIFGGNKKSDLTRSDSQPKLSPLTSEEKAAKRLSNYLPPQDSTIYSRPTPANTNRRESTDTEERSDGSTFSGRTGRSANTNSNTNSTWSAGTQPTIAGQIIHPFSHASYVIQSTEVTISKRDIGNGPEQNATSVHISSAGTASTKICDSSKLSPSSEMFDFPVARSQIKGSFSEQILREDIQLSPKGFPVTVRMKNGDTWRPPDAWECPTSPTEGVAPKSPTSATLRSRTLKDKKHSSSLSDLAHLRRSIRRMEAASVKIMLERLKEEWIEVADASVYRELELEKQLWMLCALRYLNKKQQLAQAISHSPAKPAKPTKVLSLYENHASASFLSAISIEPEVHHLSSSPLSPRSYTNIHPLAIPSPISKLPYASSIFKAVYAFSIPIQLPANSLPAVLRECHRALIPGGTLHLTILDPSPLPPTLGPNLRTWLDNHLLINLERQFRCMNPSRLFPVWLSDAGLRATGSTITTTNFYASPPDSFSDSSKSSIDGLIITNGGREVEERGKTPTESDGRRELKSHVGRMLWRETWGAFVEGDKWWWDDKSIMEECERLGTVWEYALIEAVNERASYSQSNMG